MKTNLLIIYIGILLGITSCSSNAPKLQNGDLLFVLDNSSAMGGAIEAATGEAGERNFTHVAILMVDQGKEHVLEATSKHGVRVTPLTDFLNESAKIDGRYGVVAMRLKDSTGVTQSIKRALQHLGKDYDYSYHVDNDKFYCSELVWESYRRENGDRIFHDKPMNFRAKDGTMPEFWIELFDRLGEEIPEGQPGTNPNDMSKEECLEEVYRWF